MLNAASKSYNNYALFCKYMYVSFSISQQRVLTAVLFNIGSDGKITVMAERMDVVSCIGNLIHNTVSGSLAVQVCLFFRFVMYEHL